MACSAAMPVANNLALEVGCSAITASAWSIIFSATLKARSATRARRCSVICATTSVARFSAAIFCSASRKRWAAKRTYTLARWRFGRLIDALVYYGNFRCRNRLLRHFLDKDPMRNLGEVFWASALQIPRLRAPIFVGDDRFD
jgi:hypothetical protein